MSTPQEIPGSWTVVHVDPIISVEIGSVRPALDEEVEHEVAAAWRAALTSHPALFNGEVFSVDELGAHRISGHWTEYRRIAAQIRTPALRKALGVRPLAVAGLIEGPDGIVFGLRQQTAVYQAHRWQLAPAGNVDRGADRGGRIDLMAALANELREELGLEAGAVFGPRPICVVEHPDAGILDLCIGLRTDLTASAIYHAHAQGGDGEYPEIAVVPRPKLATFLGERGDAIAPQAVLFLARYGALEP